MWLFMTHELKWAGCYGLTFPVNLDGSTCQKLGVHHVPHGTASVMQLKVYCKYLNPYHPNLLNIAVMCKQGLDYYLVNLKLYLP